MIEHDFHVKRVIIAKNENKTKIILQPLHENNYIVSFVVIFMKSASDNRSYKRLSHSPLSK